MLIQYDRYQRSPAFNIAELAPYHIYACIVLTLDYCHFNVNSIRSILRALKWIDSCHTLINGGDLILRGSPPNRNELNRLLFTLEHSTPGVIKAKSFIQKGLLYMRA